MRLWLAALTTQHKYKSVASDNALVTSRDIVIVLWQAFDREWQRRAAAEAARLFPRTDDEDQEVGNLPSSGISFVSQICLCFKIAIIHRSLISRDLT